MKSHETRLAAGELDRFIEDIKPVIQAGGSDTATLDKVFELLCRAGRDAPMAKALMIPASIGSGRDHAAGAPGHVPVLQRGDGAVGRAGGDRGDGRALGDRGAGPQRAAAAALHDHGEQADRRRLRDRDGDVRRGGRSSRRAASGRARPSRVDLDDARFYADDELKDLLAARQPFGAWAERITKIDQVVKTDAPEPVLYEGEELRRRQLAVGTTLEDLEMILHPMVEDSAEAVGSMGDDTPIAVLSEKYRGLHHYFRQAFAQVTNPPIDSLRETRVMTLKTRLGNLGNVLDEDSSQCDLLQLESPVLSTAEFAAMAATMGGTMCRVDCTFPVDEGEAGLRPRSSGSGARLRRACGPAART